MTHKIVIEEYSLEWPVVFQKLKAVYEKLPGNLLVEIHHVGSTSVEGMSAKPIIDIDLVVEQESDLNPVIYELEKIGYTHLGDLGIVGREAFRCNSELTPQDGSNRKWLKHNLYLNLKNGVSLRNHLCLRDYLRRNPGKAFEYSKLKIQLAKDFPDDIDMYIEKKTPFIIEILCDAEFDQDTLQGIIEQNKAKK